MCVNLLVWVPGLTTGRGLPSLYASSKIPITVDIFPLKFVLDHKHYKNKHIIFKIKPFF